MTRTVLTGIIAAALLCAPIAVAAAEDPAPPRAAELADITFVKHLADPDAFRFEGRTGGAVRGRLTSQLIRQTAPATDDVQFVEFRWTITSPGHDLVIVTDGTLDSHTGVVSMTGTVTSGWRAGAEVLERGQLTDAATNTFVGDLVLLSR